MCTGRPPFRAETTAGRAQPRLRRHAPADPRGQPRRSPTGWPRSSSGCTPRTRPTASSRPPRWPSCSAGTWPTLQQPTTTVFPASAFSLGCTFLLPRPTSSSTPFRPAKEARPRSSWLASRLDWLRRSLDCSSRPGLLASAHGLRIVPETHAVSPSRLRPAVIGARRRSAAESAWSPGRTTEFVQVRRWIGHAGSVKSVAISPDGRFALSGSGYPSGDATARVWDPRRAAKFAGFGGSAMGQVLGVAISPDGRRALTCGQSPVVRLWDVKTGREIRRLEGHPGAVNAVAFSPDGRHAVSAGIADALVRMWDLETGRELRRPRRAHLQGFLRGLLPGRAVRALGRRGSDRAGCGMPRLDARFGSYPACRSRVESVAFSPDGRLALAGGQDRIGWLWDVETGREVPGSWDMRGSSRAWRSSRVVTAP